MLQYDENGYEFDDGLSAPTSSTPTAWDTWIQGVGGNMIGKATAAAYSQPYEIQKMKIQALGTNGLYTEGKAGILKPGAAVVGIPTNLLLIGGAALLAVLLLKG